MGHIELPFPMYHALFFEHMIKIIRSLCFFCSRVVLTNEEVANIPDIAGKMRLLHVYQICKGRRKCPHCGAPRPSYVRSGSGLRCDWPTDIKWESPEEESHCTAPFTQAVVHSLLENMTNADCYALGFDPNLSHPKNMIMTALAVPPPAVRPTISSSEGSVRYRRRIEHISRGCASLSLFAESRPSDECFLFESRPTEIARPG